MLARCRDDSRRLASIVARRIVSAVWLGALIAAIAACCASAQATGDGSQPASAAPAASASATRTPRPHRSSCGRAAPETLAETAGAVATQIYDRELASPEVYADQRQVTRFQPLLRALASGDRTGVSEAVTSLVYSHTHVVRLRVTQGSEVLADVGGPYVIAPVGGALRFHGKVVGRYLLSVQDDLGYVKLETRFIGFPLVLREGASRLPIEGTLAPGPASISTHRLLRYDGVAYEPFSFTAKAFPRGALRVSLLAPVSRPLARESCAQIKISELSDVSARIWRRFSLTGGPLSGYVDSVASLTGALSYVRSQSRLLAGSARHAPRRLPDHGSVRYRGRTYAVSSFAAQSAQGPVRVYLLVAA